MRRGKRPIFAGNLPANLIRANPADPSVRGFEQRYAAQIHDGGHRRHASQGLCRDGPKGREWRDQGHDKRERGSRSEPNDQYLPGARYPAFWMKRYHIVSILRQVERYLQKRHHGCNLDSTDTVLLAGDDLHLNAEAGFRECACGGVGFCR